jgi:hypothetical protein
LAVIKFHDEGLFEVDGELIEDYKDALSFDGIDDYVVIPNSVSSTEITFECWASIKSFADWASVIGNFNHDNNKGINIIPSTSNLVKIMVGDGVSPYSSEASRHDFSNVSISLNEWNHYAVTYKDNTVELFINGVSKGTRSGSVSLSSLNTIMGIWSYSYSGYFLNGIVKDCRQWNVARTQSQIQDNMNKNVQGQTGLVGYWKCNDTYSTTLIDYSINQNHGIINGAIRVLSMPERFQVFDGGYSADDALSFDGVNDNVTVAGNGFGKFNHQNFTVEAWINTPNLSGEKVIFSYDYISHVPPYYAIQFRVNGDCLLFGFNNNSVFNAIISEAGSIEANKWIHVSATYQDGSQKIYVNGIEKGSGIYSGAITFYNQSAWIGNGVFGGYFNGKMKDVRFWNVTRTQTQIQNNMYSDVTGQTGLVGYWKFNDITIYNDTTLPKLVDSSGNNNHGTIDGATKVKGSESPSRLFGASEFVEDRKDAVYFDGVDDYIEVLNHSSLNSITGTWEAWIKFHDIPPTTGSPLIFKADTFGSQSGINLLINPSGAFNVQIKNYGEFVDLTTAPSLYNDNKWHLVSFTFISGGTCNLYVDGILKYTATSPVFSMSTNNLRFGSGQDIYWNYFKGHMKDVRIWNVARTQQQISDNMNKELKGNESGLVGYWKLNESYGTSVIDSTSNANNGSFGGNPQRIADGEVWMEFDGVNDHISIPTTSLTSDSKMTIEMKFKWDGVKLNSASLNDWAGLITHGISYNSSNFSIIMNRNTSSSSNDIRFYSNNSSVLLHSIVMDKNEHHIAIVCNGTSYSMYFDGVNVHNNTSTAISSSSKQLYIGKGDNSSYFWGGLIKDVRIWNVARTQKQIQDNMYEYLKGDEQGLIALYKFNEASGQALDSTSNGRNGTVNGGATRIYSSLNKGFSINYGTTSLRTIGEFSERSTNGLKFDGVNDYVSLGTSTSLKTTSQTIECWVNINSIPTNENIGFVLFGSYLDLKGLFLSIQNNGKIQVRTHNGSTSYNGNSNISLSLNRWYHVVGVIDDVNHNIKIYVNGIPDSTSSMPSYLVADNSVISYVGGWNAGDGNLYSMMDGKISDVRIWNIARTQFEIERDMNKKLSGSETGLVAYYPFDEKEGDVVRDKTSNGNNGVIYGASRIFE